MKDDEKPLIFHQDNESPIPDRRDETGILVSMSDIDDEYTKFLDKKIFYLLFRS